MFDLHHYSRHLQDMNTLFINRRRELDELDAIAPRGGLLVIFGRRRVGKTWLLTHWLKQQQGLYSQAIEGAKETQLNQVFQDIKENLKTAITPKTWPELLELLSLENRRMILCLDEFPYLTT